MLRDPQQIQMVPQILTTALLNNTLNSQPNKSNLNLAYPLWLSGNKIRAEFLEQNKTEESSAFVYVALV